MSVPVLLSAGWLAGRGPLGQPVGWSRRRQSLLDRPGAVAIAVVLAAAALAGAWMQWQPLRSDQSYQAALGASTNAQAFADARKAIDDDPLATAPRFLLASLYESVKDVPAGRGQLVKATEIQPENPLTWAQLGTFEQQLGRRRQAIYALRRELMLDRTSDPFATAAFNTVQRLQDQLAATAARARAGQ